METAHWRDDELHRCQPTFRQGSRDERQNISDPRSHVNAERVRYHLGRWRIYHLNDTSSSSPMRKTASVDDNDFLRPDGSNLAAFLYLLRERHEDSYGLIQRTVQTSGALLR